MAAIDTLHNSLSNVVGDFRIAFKGEILTALAFHMAACDTHNEAIDAIRKALMDMALTPVTVSGGASAYTVFAANLKRDYAAEFIKRLDSKLYRRKLLDEARKLQAKMARETEAKFPDLYDN